MRHRAWQAVVIVLTAGLATGSLASSRPAAAAVWWQPTAGTTWQIQINGEAIDRSFDVEAYDVDLFETGPGEIDALHAAGRKVICYFSAGSRENWRPDAGDFPDAAVGKPLDNWPGEKWVDTRSTAIRDIMEARLDLAVDKGCDAVDPDNVDAGTYPNAQRRTGFPLTPADQLDYNRFLSDQAHARGLAVGLKNDVEQIPDLLASFDFTVNEECFTYHECDAVQAFIGARKPVFQIEYGGKKKARRICRDANLAGFSSHVKKLNLGPWRIDCQNR